MSLNSALSSMSKSLGMEVSIVDGKLVGGGVISFPSGDAPAMSFTATPVCHSYNNQLCVLFHLSGDLHFLLSSNPATGAVCIFFLDGSKFPKGLPPLPPTSNLKEVMSLLKVGVVKSHFYQAGSGWSPLKLS